MRILNGLVLSLSLLWPVLGGGKLVIKGIDPHQQKIYQSHLTSNNEKWTCLNDNNVQINITQINDGICDCPDGSDEPGTSACNVITDQSAENSLFYCQNEGFIPRYIDKSLVNDGVCDCCNCSDEMEGASVDICAQVDKLYHNIIDGELERADLGRRKLSTLFERAKIDIQETSEEGNLLDGLKDDIASLKTELNVNSELEKTERGHYLTQLKKDDQILYQYEQIDFDTLTDTLNSIYDSIAQNSQMFTDLVYILETLAGTFTPSLNDKVVNNNIYKFQDELTRLKVEEKIGIDPNTDNEQRDQLLEYFNKELPALFWKGESSHPPEYVIKKAQFVKMLIEGKVMYTSTVFQYIDEFSAIMKDIVDNHNVNFQDNGVKDAIQMYSDYLDKYAVPLKEHKVELPQTLVKILDKLIKIIENNVSKIIIHEEQEVNTGEKNVLMGFVNNLLHQGDEANRKNLGQLKNQLLARKKTIKDLKREIDVKKKELATLEDLENISDQDIKADNRKLLQLKELIEVLPTGDTCIENVINGYKYSLCLDSAAQSGYIYQTEDKPNGNGVLVGRFARSYLDRNLIKQNYIDKIKMDNLDEDIDVLNHLTNSTTVVGQTEYYLGPLENVNNGYIAKFEEGDLCWNGPLRSATVLIKCSNEFKVNSVSEMTKCNYQFDAEGPWGCNL